MGKTDGNSGANMGKKVLCWGAIRGSVVCLLLIPRRTQLLYIHKCNYLHLKKKYFSMMGI